jgi:uncharacterized membrane protein YoaK (UPF0700 family)
MAITLPIRSPRLVGALLTLTAVTGLIDAVSYLRMGHVFVANMTGNVVFLGFALQTNAGLSIPASTLGIGGFLVGAAAGGRLGRHLDGRPRHWLRIVFTVQAGVLAAVTVLGGAGVLGYTGHRALVTTSVLAAAFGLQNATVRRLGAADLTTTVLTLGLTGLAADSRLAGGPGARAPRRLGSVLAMLAGAATGAVLLQVTGPTTVIALATVLVVVVGALLTTAGRPVRSASGRGTSAPSRPCRRGSPRRGPRGGARPAARR